MRFATSAIRGSMRRSLQKSGRTCRARDGLQCGWSVLDSSPPPCPKESLRRSPRVPELKRLTVVTGHYGCGKTNLSVNLALDLAEAHDDGHPRRPRRREPVLPLLGLHRDAREPGESASSRRRSRAPRSTPRRFPRRSTRCSSAPGPVVLRRGRRRRGRHGAGPLRRAQIAGRRLRPALRGQPLPQPHVDTGRGRRAAARDRGRIAPEGDRRREQLAPARRDDARDRARLGGLRARRPRPCSACRCGSPRCRVWLLGEVSRQRPSDGERSIENAYPVEVYVRTPWEDAPGENEEVV